MRYRLHVLGRVTGSIVGVLKAFLEIDRLTETRGVST